MRAMERVMTFKQKGKVTKQKTTDFSVNCTVFLYSLYLISKF